MMSWGERLLPGCVFKLHSLFMVFTATLRTDSSWVSSPSITEPNSPGNTQHAMVYRLPVYLGHRANDLIALSV